MSAVLTKKPGADYASELTFPAVFAEQAKANNLGYKFYPVAEGNRVELMKGSGLQYDYHEQKRLDAHRRCLNGVKDDKASMARYLNSHANYVLPKPVLGQRKYANPSNGNQADIYSNRPVFGFSGGDMYSSLKGGVLRTEEGQKWAMKKLKERIPQLNAIQAAKDAFLTGMPSVAQEGSLPEFADITAKVELYGLLQRVESDVEQGIVNNRTLQASQAVLKLLFAFAPFALVRELEELTNKTEFLEESFDKIVEQEDGGVGRSVAGEAMMKNAEYLAGIYEKMREYLVRMNGVVGRPRKEREKLSAVYIKALGFAEMLKSLKPIGKIIKAEIEEKIQEGEGEGEGEDDGEDDDKKEKEDKEDEGDGNYDEGDDEDDDDDDPNARDAFLKRLGKEPKYDKDGRDAFAYNSGSFNDDGTAAQPAPRSRESAQMSVEEAEQEDPQFEMKYEEKEADSEMTEAERQFAEERKKELKARRNARNKAKREAEKQQKKEENERQALIKQRMDEAAKSTEKKPRKSPQEILSPIEYARYMQYKNDRDSQPPYLTTDAFDADKIDARIEMAIADKAFRPHKSTKESNELRRRAFIKKFKSRINKILELETEIRKFENKIEYENIGRV